MHKTGELPKNRISTGRGEKVFLSVNLFMLIVLTLVCILPFINIIAISFSSAAATYAGKVTLWPVEFNLNSYQFITRNSRFIESLLVSLKRVGIGLPINMLLLILAAYPLSKPKEKLKGRSLYVAFFFITMVFSGGLIPTFMVVNGTGLINSIWALILPYSVNVFNLIILLNFFRQLPSEIEDAANIDGAGHWKTLVRIVLPLSKAVLATLVLFTVVYHWNSWFDGLIYMNEPKNYPLQSYMQTLLVDIDFKNVNQNDMHFLKLISDKTTKASRIVLASIPVLAVYPFLQKYFTKGIVLGSVKG